jgi:hypothetical protein
MNALATPNAAVKPVEQADLRFYVHLTSGRIEEVWPATDVVLVADELVFKLGTIPVAQFPRNEVYFATRANVAPPVMF